MQMDTNCESTTVIRKSQHPNFLESTTSIIPQKKNANTAYLVSVWSYRWVNGQRIYSTDSDAFVCTPRDLKTVKSTASALTVKWSRLYGISGYYVYKSTSPNSGYRRTATLAANRTSVTIHRSSSSGSTYFYIVPYRTYNGKRYLLPHKIYRMYTVYY